jgi:hypothetical protein
MDCPVRIKSNEVQSDEGRGLLHAACWSEAAGYFRDRVASSFEARQHRGVGPLRIPFDHQDAQFQFVATAELPAGSVHFLHHGADVGQLITLLETWRRRRCGERDGDETETGRHVTSRRVTSDEVGL